MAENPVSPWQKISGEVKYDNPWIRVREDQVLNPSGNPGIYGVVEFKNLAIGIIPIDENDCTWLVGQYRYPLSAYSWEIIEGGGALDVPHLISASRELKEEAGLEAEDWEELMRMHLSNSVTNELAIVFLAKKLRKVSSEPEETEQLTLKYLSVDEAIKMALNGEITDSISVAALLKLAAYRNEDFAKNRI
jgi:ADP-ribose pyrophosphatase